MPPPPEAATPGWLHSSFYRFVPVADPQGLAAAVRALAQQRGLTGTVLVASEGISGAVAGAGQAVRAFEQALQVPTLLHGALCGMAFKRSGGHTSPQTVPPTAPFAKLKVHVKPEIVALGLPPAAAHGAAPSAANVTGTDPGVLSPQAWRHMLQRGGVRVLDNRNHFEYRLGHFAGAVDPQVHNFRDFVAYVQQHAAAWQAAGQPVAMYCTGGIRCEKTAPWMRSLGLQVLQLEGGILNYFEQMPDAHRDWQGSCFVFDNRVALDTRLQETHTPAAAVYDPAHADEAWRLQRASRLQHSAKTSAAAEVPAHTRATSAPSTPAPSTPPHDGPPAP